MIYVLIAGSYTPFALLALNGTLATHDAGRRLGRRARRRRAPAGLDRHPKWRSRPCTSRSAGVGGRLRRAPGDDRLVGVAGLDRRGCSTRSAPSSTPASGRTRWPRVFGYHEVFHALVIAAAALHYAVVAFVVLPRG